MSNAAKKVLVVAYFFPPAGGAGVQRPLKFVKYLKRLGWNPAVLTAENPSVPTLDEGLLKDVPTGVKVYTAPTLEPSYAQKQKIAGSDQDSTCWRQKLKSLVTRFFIPDMQILWWPGLVLHLTAILRTGRPDVVYVTAPPFSSLIPVTILGKIFRVPVVIDFRDEWIFARNNIENAGRGAVVEFFDFWLERLTVKLCSDFTAATQSYVESIRLRHQGATRGKGVAITNGYDEDDFKGLKRQRQPDGKFRILYTGTVWKATSLEPFVKGVERLLVDRPELKDVLSVRIVGRVVESERHYLEPLIRLGIIDIAGYFSHDQVLQEMFDADLLLLTLSALPGAERIIPGKVFEYLATGNRIMSIVPEGEASRIVIASAAFGTISPSSVDTIMSQLSEEVSSLGNKKNRHETCGSCNIYSRSELTVKLTMLLNRLTGPI